MSDIQQEIRKALEAHKWICEHAEFRHDQRAKAGRYGQSVRTALIHAGEEIEEASRVGNLWFADREKVKAERDALRARVAELEKAMLGVEHMVDIAHHPSDWAEYDDKLKAVIAAFHDALAASEGGRQ